MIRSYRNIRFTPHCCIHEKLSNRNSYCYTCVEIKVGTLGIYVILNLTTTKNMK